MYFMNVVIQRDSYRGIVEVGAGEWRITLSQGWRQADPAKLRHSTRACLENNYSSLYDFKSNFGHYLMYAIISSRAVHSING